MASIQKPPEPLMLTSQTRSLFLAGSIEVGEACQWRKKVEDSLADLDIVLLNPRRDDWDKTWVQSINNELFRNQVAWELKAQEMASAIAMYFDPQTHSPITLLELGLFARSGKLFVCCPDGFWRKGNVEVVCRFYNIPLFSELEELLKAVRLLFST